MDRNRLILLSLLLTIGFAAYPQYNINFDRFHCSHHNSAIFTQALIEVCGKEKVTDLLSTELLFNVRFETDSLGYILDVNPKVSRTRGLISDTIQYKIKDYLIKEKKRFYLCYELVAGSDTCLMYNSISEHLRQEKNNTHAFGSFPFEVFYQHYDQYIRENPEDPLSIFEYLQQQIEKYLPKE